MTSHPYLRLLLEFRTDPPLGPGGDARRHGMTATVVRRALGRALIARFCPFGEPRCQPRGGRGRVATGTYCELEAACPYGVLFASSRSRRQPYALYVPPPEGSAATVEATLYGPGCELYAWLIATLGVAARRGLGKERRAWTLREVDVVHPDRSRERLAGGDLRALTPRLEPAGLALPDDPDAAPRQLAVHFLSPLRLLRDGKLLPGREPVPFELLVARILDRFEGVYGEGTSPLLEPEARRAYLEAASRVGVVRDETRWVEVEDYSARSGKEMLLGGKVGRTLYDESAARFLPALRAGEILHVGKNPTSGCGRIRADLA